MIKKILLTIVLLFSIYTPIQASDINITCFEDRKPEIIKTTTPLFNIANLKPGESVQRTFQISNQDPNNPCRIYLNFLGSTNLLTDSLNVKISSNTINTTLSNLLNSDRVLLFDTNSNQSETKQIELQLDHLNDNSLSNKTSSFDIQITSEWGNSDEDGDVEGAKDKSTLVEKISEVLGIGGGDEETELSEEKGINDIENKDNCDARTLWWLPILLQAVATIILANIKIRKIYIKVSLVILLALLAYILGRYIGCGCSDVFLCKNHYILNILTTLLLLLRVRR